MEEVSEEDGDTGKEEKESIWREFGMDGESDDEEREHAGECLWNGFCEEDEDDSAREGEEEYDRFLERVTEISRYERGRENKEDREDREEVFEKCVEVDMRGDAEKIGERKEEWPGVGECRYSSLREIIPRLGDPVIGIEIGKRIVGSDHTSHDGEVEQGARAEKLEGEYFLIFFRDIEGGVFALVPSEEYRGREENKDGVDERKGWKKNVEILMLDDEKERRDDE